MDYMSSKNKLPKTPTQSIIYKDDWLTICLALYPLTKGHTIIVWKKPKPDLHDLSDSEYDYLMEIMDVMRDVLLQTLDVKKVYLLYMDEAEQVHWHLIPRYKEKVFSIFVHEPKKTKDFSLMPALQEAFHKRLQTRKVTMPKK